MASVQSGGDAPGGASAPSSSSTAASSVDYDPMCINMWSGPRCCSTSIMYSWAQRADCNGNVLDEPLYANYLKITGLPRPYVDLVMAAQDTDGNRIVSQCMLAPRAPGESPLRFVKHIGKQKLGVDTLLFRRAQHFILVRNPLHVIKSYVKVLAPTLQELGYTALLEILSELRAAGRSPIVILSDDVVEAPAATLSLLCGALGVPWDERMLSWPAGPKPYDGVWAPWWYTTVHGTTGFEAGVRGASEEPLTTGLHRDLFADCWPLYQHLKRHALRPQRPPGAVPRPLPPAGAASDPVSHPSSADQAAGSGAAAACYNAAASSSATSASGAGAVAVAPPLSGTHATVPDARNAHILVGIRNGVSLDFELVPRAQAAVSVLDSGFVLGDGVWEGLRLHRGVLLSVHHHLERLYEGAAALDLKLDLTLPELKALIYRTVDANGMGDASGVHIRLMVSRGLKSTPYQNPKVNIGGPTIVIVPEYKAVAPGPREKGIRLMTVHVRRGSPDAQDPGLCSQSKINCITACIAANMAGVDEGLMLDPHGFVATCNSTNFFIVRGGEVWAPTTKYQLAGITRQHVIDIATAAGVVVRECDFALTKVYSAEEAFVTGTFSGLIPVTEVDGRRIGDGCRGPLVARLQELYMAKMDATAAKGRV